MKVRRFRSFAKINLGLEVMGRNPDGYHQLKTIFATVSHHDVIEIAQTARRVTVRCDDPAIPDDESNLAHRAAVLMLRHSRRQRGVSIRIRKRIAAGGGLGGGSSNAASVLLALDRIWGLRLGPQALIEAAASLGADVPYFLFGGPALGLGRGDDIHPLQLKLPPRVLLVPGRGGVGTAAVFRRFAKAGRRRPVSFSPIDAVLEGARRKDGRAPEPLLAALENDLEPAARAESPDLASLSRKVRRVARQSSAIHAAMSGSGSSFFLLFDQADGERTAVAAFEAEGIAAIPCRLLSRRSYRSRFEIAP